MDFPFILEMAYGLSILIPRQSKSLYQRISDNMDKAPEAMELSLCKPKGGKKDEKIGCQNLNHVKSDPCTNVLLFCD